MKPINPAALAQFIANGRSVKVAALVKAIDDAMRLTGTDPHSPFARRMVEAFDDRAWKTAEKTAGTRKASETTRENVRAVYRERCGTVAEDLGDVEAARAAAESL